MDTSKLEALKLAKIPVPLSTFLLIYCRARHECYIDYMEGAKALHDYLTAGGLIPLAIDLPPRDSNYRLPPLYGNYEIQGLAKIITGTPDLYASFNTWRTTITRTEFAIYTEMQDNIRNIL